MDKKKKAEKLAKLLEKHGKEYAKLLGTKNIALALYHRTNEEDAPAIHLYNHDKKLTTDKLAVSWLTITASMYNNIVMQNVQASVLADKNKKTGKSNKKGAE